MALSIHWGQRSCYRPPYSTFAKCSVPAAPIGLLRTGPGDASKAARQAADKKILLPGTNPFSIKKREMCRWFHIAALLPKLRRSLQRYFAKSLTYE